MRECQVEFNYRAEHKVLACTFVFLETEIYTLYKRDIGSDFMFELLSVPLAAILFAIFGDKFKNKEDDRKKIQVFLK